MNFRGVKVKPTADKTAKHMKIQLTARDGWLRRLAKGNSLARKHTFDEALSAPVEVMENFRTRLSTVGPMHMAPPDTAPLWVLA
jgi:hypothetical protein